MPILDLWQLTASTVLVHGGEREGGGWPFKIPGGFAKLFGLPLSMLNNSVAELEQM